MWFWIAFVLLGLVVYLPISGLFLWAIAVPLDKWLQKTGRTEFAQPISYALVFLCFIAAILVHGGFFGWYDKLEKPGEIIVFVDAEVQNDFYKYEERDGKIYLTVSDKNFSMSNESHLMDNGDIHFDIENANAKKDRANLKWTVEIDGEKYVRNTLPTGTELHIFTASFSLKEGENIVRVTAKNDLGEMTKTVVINKLRTEDECRKSENAEVSLCKRFNEANLADSEKKKAEEEAKNAAKAQEKGTSNSVYDYEIKTLNGTDNTANCSYVKYGKCWDDVIEQADNDGAMDAYLNKDGFLGYPSYDGCEGVCEDIYEDAYWKSYDNYQKTK